MTACAPNLMAQLACVRPRFVLGFGATALQGLVGRPKELKIGQVRGRPVWVPVVAGVWPVHWRVSIEAWFTYHPAAALRNGTYEKKIREDLEGFVEWRKTNGIYPFDCVVCNGEAALYDDNGIAWCERHAARQLSLLD